ncbi:hypothetical protein LR48_Vigan382s000200 [Vigna angularis]|uniref:Transposase Tnp1/En/Spm-like domain-containing protein n=1 Tax=Phaseolus angularis TaxID=3914 RepID=A0A0L9TAA6_PHAAN|nr:hypothetical protein LR48_Vigan382s000200 [Vigna angularis]
MSQETLRQMDLQWEQRLNQSMRSMEQRFMEQLKEQKEIQRALEEKLHSMTQGNMGTAETPTPPRVNTRGSCSAVEPTQYSGQYELFVDGDPPRIVAVGRVLEGGQTIHGVPILPQAQVPVPTPEINFVGEAIGSFIAWPRALIMSHIATPQGTRAVDGPHVGLEASIGRLGFGPKLPRQWTSIFRGSSLGQGAQASYGSSFWCFSKPF